MTSGAYHKTSPLVTMPSALHTKSKVCEAALLADWNFNWHSQLAGSWGLQLKLNSKSTKQRKNKIKQLWGFGGGRRLAASPLNLQLGSGPVQLTLITIVKRTRHKLLKNIRTSVLKTHSHITHTYLGCLPHLLLCDSFIWYWNIEQIFGRFLFSYSLWPSRFLSISVFILSFFPLLFPFSPPSVGW